VRCVFSDLLRLRRFSAADVLWPLERPGYMLASDMGEQTWPGAWNRSKAQVVSESRTSHGTQRVAFRAAWHAVSK